jgi:hypothetical protein
MGEEAAPERLHGLALQCGPAHSPEDADCINSTPGVPEWSGASPTSGRNAMNSQRAKGPPPKPGQRRPSPQVDASRQREKAESTEAEGRHKNSGQKDHKGAR